MDAVSQLVASWGFIAVQFLGLFSMAAARMNIRRLASIFFQVLFFFCLMTIGCITVLTVSGGESNWLSAGATLSVMAVGAVVDLGRGQGGAVI